MSRRRSSRRGRRHSSGPGASNGPAISGPDHVEGWPDGEWVVRPLSGSSSAKTYRCPGCDQEIRPATPHLVAWPAAGIGTVDERRHWHPPCWQRRLRRTPTVKRPPRAPWR